MVIRCAAPCGEVTVKQPLVKLPGLGFENDPNFGDAAMPPPDGPEVVQHRPTVQIGQRRVEQDIVGVKRLGDLVHALPEGSRGGHNPQLGSSGKQLHIGELRRKP